MYRQEEVAAALNELMMFESHAGDVESVRAAGPAIGPVHTGVIPPPPELRKGVPHGAVLSPLAITLRGLRKSPYTRKRVAQIVVHTTGQGPASRSKKDGFRKPAFEYALDYYLNGAPNGGFPHYVIDFPGTIYATCDERQVAYHAGWVHPGKADLFRSAGWRAPAWWLAAWGRYGFKSPLNLVPRGGKGPNSLSIGIEMLITTDLKYTDEQYKALARLILDIEKRHGLSIPAAPSPLLLGHEDYSPVLGKGGRAVQAGGWDPGAHRTNPYFSWSKVWSYMRGSRPTFESPGSKAPGILDASGLTRAERMAIEITSTFETGKRGGFFGLSGNFDGQGLSFGLVNWNIGTGSLQPLLRAFATEQPARWNAIFGPHAARFLSVIAPAGAVAAAAQLRFAIDEMNVSRVIDGKRRWSVKEPWVTYFTRLSEDPAFQRIQVRAVRDLLARARYYCELFGLKSERAFTFMFDAVSSHGKWWMTKKWNGVEKRRELYASRLKTLEATHGKGSVPEREMLLMLADVLAETSSERWRQNVRERKRWFVTGDHRRAQELKGLEPRADVPYLTSVPVGPTPAPSAATAKELVRFAQIAMNASEGEHLSDDGELGPATRAALERFRARYGLPSSNVLDGRVQIALAQKTIEAITRTSRFATIGERDARTVQEIRSFQLANGVSASGEIDAPTRAAFVAALSRASQAFTTSTSRTSFYEQTIRRHPLFDSPRRIADLDLLEPVTRQRVRAIIRDAAEQGIKLMVWETYRSKARQQELFKRGTTKLRDVGVHHYGLACDLVKNENGQPSWKGDFTFMAALARSNKLVWGGDWGIAGKKPSFYDPVHVQRCSLSRQKSLFNGTWYPDELYDPYMS